MRITRKDLYVLIDQLNKKGFGEFGLDTTNGRFRLERVGGIGRQRVSSRGTAKEVYNVIQAILRVL